MSIAIVVDGTRPAPSRLAQFPVYLYFPQPRKVNTHVLGFLPVSANANSFTSYPSNSTVTPHASPSQDRSAVSGSEQTWITHEKTGE
ncbi:hypothetical protein AURDEDRAFT_177811 [Auricularia subglabra TFB-10046 SS5]|uniref:Uncharacterized protein n=1 Tax=Auricularia subglabra (strain TFB-10046 / SS5) TaxID=717982 RepID=J0WMQ7_AURST|nr:hypothetical protein AURDEDRAFT_177811 [Auricularia subglabra TFB-10046 SS5]